MALYQIKLYARTTAATAETDGYYLKSNVTAGVLNTDYWLVTENCTWLRPQTKPSEGYEAVGGYLANGTGYRLELGGVESEPYDVAAEYQTQLSAYKTLFAKRYLYVEIVTFEYDIEGLIAATKCIGVQCTDFAVTHEPSFKRFSYVLKENLGR